MEGFKNMLPSASKVLRDGKITQIAAEKLVRGDVVEVVSGEKIPADIRIISCIEMKVDNSALTGEVEPLLRAVECSHPEEPFETKNLAFFGTLVKEGRGRGIVVNIAEKTMLGQIADLASTGGQQKSPLRVELDRFVLLITIIALVLGVGFFFLAYFVVHYNALQCIIFGIGILVANVPEGLLGCITISLAITAQKLAEKQVLVKNLEAVETLGSTSCICSDKTGTLTQNKMTVENLWYDGEIHKADNKENKGANFEYQYEVDDPSFRTLHECAMICSEAKFDITEDQVKTPGFKYSTAPVIGDASETALVKFYQPIEDITITRGKYSIAKCKDNSDAKMPFNSTNKYALSIVLQETSDSYYCAYIKGAPEKIWKFCGRILHEGRFKDIDAEENRKFDRVNLQFGKNGERVLGFGKLHLSKERFPKDFNFITSTPDNFNFPMENFVFVGLLSLMDPPKETVPFAVKKCKSAGIKVIMVTGDQPPTAAAIAKQVNIINMKTNEDYKEEGYSSAEALEKAQAIVIHGDMIVKAFEESEEEGAATLLKWVSKPQIVFARTTPAQKLQIVKACQDAGNIVGVTGDGVNDSPAIKQADIGISMGISGSDVSKDAADMVLLNDDFASIVDGIEEGRKIFDNLKKTVVYLLTSNMTEIWPFLALIIVQIPLPLSNIFMLVICVGTDIYPALSLAYEESEFDIMTRKPRKIDDHLVSGKLLCHAYGQMGEIATAAGFFTYFTIMNVYGFPPSQLLGMLSLNAYNPRDDINYNTRSPYNPNAFFFGAQMNPGDSYNCSAYVNLANYPNWLSTTNDVVDLRQVYLNCNKATGVFTQAVSWPSNSSCYWDTLSSESNKPVCFTTEALFYAQSGYFSTVVLVQWSNIFACKSRKVYYLSYCRLH